jgi:hypothetical protein
VCTETCQGIDYMIACVKFSESVGYIKTDYQNFTGISSTSDSCFVHRTVLLLYSYKYQLRHCVCLCN